jgi:hypothetical protein
VENFCVILNESLFLDIFVFSVAMSEKTVRFNETDVRISVSRVVFLKAHIKFSNLANF